MSGYLDTLAERLGWGAEGLTREFKDRRASYVCSRQMPDGGFRGRAGESDIYYTDFALRTLALVAPDSAAFGRAARYVESLPGAPQDAAERFNRLNCARMLRRRGCTVRPQEPAFGASPRQPAPGPYGVFLSALCAELLDGPVPAGEIREALGARQCPDGGFSEMPDEATGLTSSTAAAVAALRMAGCLAGPVAERAAVFLAGMQTADGGFRAHATAPEADLLSTFSAMVALSDAGALDRADLAGAARFIRSLAADDGGFRGSPSDAETDVEYTYYGVGCAALLRSHITAKR